MEHIPLIDELLKITMGSMLIGIALAYAWWSSIRITFFRQDLFEIRDRLWDQARELDALSEPRYVRMREVLNACISAASFLSLPQLVREILTASHSARQITPSERNEVEKIVAEAENHLVSRVTRYLILDRPVSGLFFGFVLLIASLTLLAPKTFIQDIIRSWAATIGPLRLSAVAREDRAAHAT